MKDEKENQRRLGSVEREAEKAVLRKKIKSIREGHLTGGYVETEVLKAEEKKLHKILSAEFKELVAEHGYSPVAQLNHKAVRACEVELNGLSYKPTLVVKED